MNENENLLDEDLLKESRQITYADHASGGKRFANYIIDLIVIYVIYFLFIYLSDGEYNDLVDSLLIYPFMLVYYIFFEFQLKGKTIGKFVTSTKVVDLNGNPPTFKIAFIRSISRFIPFDAFSFFGSYPKGWHDQIAYSRVVNDNYLVR